MSAGFPMADDSDFDPDAEIAEWHALSEPERRAERFEAGIIDSTAVEDGVPPDPTAPPDGSEWRDPTCGRWLRVIGINDTHVIAEVLDRPAGPSTRRTAIQRKAWVRRVRPLEVTR